MSNKAKLNPAVLEFLHKKLGKSVSTIRSDISRLKRKHKQATLNALAQVYAEQHKTSVRRLISVQDKQTIPEFKLENTPVYRTRRNGPKQPPEKEILSLQTPDAFLAKHIKEINRAYNKRCYTCVFVLTRKVFENLIAAILKVKYPKQPELYFDTSRGRNQDFSVVMENLFNKRVDFDTDKKAAIERLHQKLKPFKNDANDKVHSLFHIVENSKEIDDWNLDTIIELITRIL